jgi:twinkle protein
MAFLKTHVRCDACGSSDGAAVNDDGSSYCFVCQKHTASVYTSEQLTTLLETNMNTTDVDLSFTSIYKEANTVSMADRRISKATAERYGVVRTSHHIDKKELVTGGDSFLFPYYDKDNTLVAAKVKGAKEKTFGSVGDWTKGTLFGQQLFSSGGKYLTITEGELDALAVYQLTGSKYPAVSVRNGAGAALKDCKANYEYINSFENVIICFDGDAPGVKAAKEVAELFGAKAKVFKPLPEYKDACDWLSDSKEASFVQRWWGAEGFIPDGIVSGSSLWDVVSQPMATADCLYPWEGLNKLTYGIRLGELVTVTAGSGLGKSQLLREIVWNLLNKTDDNIGLMFLEESVRKTGLSMMSLAANTPLHLPDAVISDDERKRAFDLTLGTNRMFLFDHFGSSSIENILNRVRYMAKGLGCKYVMLDHLSIIFSSQDNNDERKAIDEIMTKLRTLVQETNISLIIVSHLKRPSDKGHEEGAATSLAQLRGSASIAQLSDMVISLERNGQHDDPIIRNTTNVRVLKNRYVGDTGLACSLLYSKTTGRMVEVETNLGDIL